MTKSDQVLRDRVFPVLVVAAVIILPVYLMTEKPLMWLTLAAVAVLALYFWRWTLIAAVLIIGIFFWWSHGYDRARAECKYEVAKLLPLRSDGGMADV